MFEIQRDGKGASSSSTRAKTDLATRSESISKLERSGIAVIDAQQQPVTAADFDATKGGKLIKNIPIRKRSVASETPIKSVDQLLKESSAGEIGRSAEIATILASKPGPDAISRLLLIKKATLSPADRIDLLACWQRQSSWVTSQEQEAMLYVAGSEAQERAGEFEVDGSEREDVASALRVTPNSAQLRIDVARTLFNHLPETITALANGDIAPQHATVIAQETAAAVRAGMPQIAIEEIEKVALAHAEFHTPAQVASKLRNTFAKVAPGLFEKNFESSRATRHVRLFKEEDGIGTILASLKIEDAQLVDQVINDYSEKLLAQHREAMGRVKFSAQHMCSNSCGARLKGNDGAAEVLCNPQVRCNHGCSEQCRDACLAENADDIQAVAALERNGLINTDFERDLRRSDAFVLAMRAADAALKASGEIHTKHRRRPTVNVTIDLPTALGLAENPGQLAGYGPIPASVARAIAADGRWKRFVTDPITGGLLDYGRESYEPPQDLQDFLIARDRTCRFPGCRQPAHLTDLDHAIPWEEGGKTSADNLGSLCRRHHNLKTHHGWKLESASDGSCTWTSPTGHKYFVPARTPLGAV